MFILFRWLGFLLIVGLSYLCAVLLVSYSQSILLHIPTCKTNFCSFESSQGCFHFPATLKES